MHEFARASQAIIHLAFSSEKHLGPSTKYPSEEPQDVIFIPENVVIKDQHNQQKDNE